jgi:superfamily II RNA helicase
VLIMTTEILRNTLFQKQMQKEDETANVKLHFEMDIENELGCVVFDEIHYINDADRGKVWEETIMLLPSHVQMLMLSATLDKEERFAEWISTVKSSEVWVAPTRTRVVPLKHYAYMTLPVSSFKKETDKAWVNEMRSMLNTPMLLRNDDVPFHDKHHKSLRKMKKYIEDKDIRIRRSFVINNVLKHLKDNDMLPAIIFIFSRRGVEQAASEVQISLFEEDCTTSSIIEEECRKIMSRLPNHAEYMRLPEYGQIIAMLRKGVAIHHSGVMPMFREMVELLFAKGYIKALFATETFSVGINMPTRTVVFAALSKFDGVQTRPLLSHEYTQMAGRAGRRGIDDVGFVIHLANMFPIPLEQDYRHILGGKPQTLTSKFKIHYNLLLNLIYFNGKTAATGDCDADSKVEESLGTFIDKSMIQREVEKEIVVAEKAYNQAISVQERLEEQVKLLSTPFDIVKQYLDLDEKRGLSKNKQRKKLEREMRGMEDSYRRLLPDLEKYKEYTEAKGSVKRLSNTVTNIRNYTSETIGILMGILIDNDFLCSNESKMALTEKGFISTQIQESFGLAMADVLFLSNYLDDLSSSQLCGLFSCFTSIRVPDECKVNYRGISDAKLVSAISSVESSYAKYEHIEEQQQLDTGSDFHLTFDIVSDVLEWCDAMDEQACSAVIRRLEGKQVFVGEFVKAIMKINNVAAELEKVCEPHNKISLLSRLREIPSKTQKFIATNQSLYV